MLGNTGYCLKLRNIGRQELTTAKTRYFCTLDSAGSSVNCATLVLVLWTLLIYQSSSCFTRSFIKRSLSDGNILLENGLPITNCNNETNNRELLPMQQPDDIREPSDSAPEISICEPNPCSRCVITCMNLVFYTNAVWANCVFLHICVQYELWHSAWKTRHVRRAAELFEKIRLPWIAFFKFPWSWFVVIFREFVWWGSLWEVT